MRNRLLRVLKGSAVFLSIGLGYALWCFFTPYALPCPFYLITHLRCPGCGVTRLCLSVLRFDFASAFSANPVLFCLLPVLALFLTQRLFRYVRYGTTAYGTLEIVFIWTTVGVLLLWGVIRNLTGI